MLILFMALIVCGVEERNIIKEMVNHKNEASNKNVNKPIGAKIRTYGGIIPFKPHQRRSD